MSKPVTELTPWTAWDRQTYICTHTQSFQNAKKKYLFCHLELEWWAFKHTNCIVLTPCHNSEWPWWPKITRVDWFWLSRYFTNWGASLCHEHMSKPWDTNSNVTSGLHSILASLHFIYLCTEQDKGQKYVFQFEGQFPSVFFDVNLNAHLLQPDNQQRLDYPFSYSVNHLPR